MPSSAEPESARPLAGVRVLDLSQLLPGPFLTQIMADLGADVIKLEPPGLGDPVRWIPPDVDGVGYAFAAVSRGKRSIVVDLKKPGGVDVAKRLAARADVFVESFRPGVLDRLGLSDATLAALNPRLVRCSLVGYPRGDHRDDVGHDLNYQALAGALSMPGGPVMPPTQVADLGGALYGATAILAALFERERTGRGRRVEIALADAALALNTLQLARARASEVDAPGWELTGTVPCYRSYACADGRHVALACLEEKFWARFCEATGIDASFQFDRGPEAHTALETLFATRSAPEWVATLREIGVPITPILRPEEVRQPASPSTPLGAFPARAPPALGEHTDEVLREAGFSPAEAERLRASQTVA